MAIEKEVVGQKKFEDNPHLPGTRDEFIENNLRLAYSIAKRFYAAGERNGVDPEELNSIAIVGMIKAYDRYDPTKFDGQVTRFSTYAVPNIEGELRRSLRDTHYANGIKISRPIKDLVHKLVRAEREYKTADEILEDFDVKREIAEDALRVLMGGGTAVSIDKPLGDDGDGTKDRTIADTLAVYDDESSLYINEFLTFLTEKERTVIDCLFVKDLSQTETGRIVGVSQVQVSRIVTKIREKAGAFARGEVCPSLSSTGKTKRKNNEEEKETEIMSKTRDEIIKLLKTTTMSYRAIADKTGASLATVEYWGGEYRKEKMEKTRAEKQAEEKRKQELKKEAKKAGKETEKAAAPKKTNATEPVVISNVQLTVKKDEEPKTPNPETISDDSKVVNGLLEEKEKEAGAALESTHCEPTFTSTLAGIAPVVKEEVPTKIATNIDVFQNGNDLSKEELRQEVQNALSIVDLAKGNIVQFTLHVTVNNNG